MAPPECRPEPPASQARLKEALAEAQEERVFSGELALSTYDTPSTLPLGFPCGLATRHPAPTLRDGADGSG
jgi:hypothetical protein